MAVPMILFALVFVAALGSSPEVLVVILGIIKAPLVARVTRSSTMVELTSDYVRGLTVIGLSKQRILFREILPNVFPVIAAVAVELTSDYVRGLTVIGLSKQRILFREILPNVFPVIAAVATLNIASAIMIEASLSFIGLGVQPP